MLRLSDASFIQHVITHIDEDLELFFTGETIGNCRSLYNLENLCLGHCGKSGGSNAGFAESPANVSLIGIDTVLFTTALIGNSLEHFDVHVLNLFQDVLAQFADDGVVHGNLPVDVLIIDQKDGTTSFLSPVSEVSIPSMMVLSL